MELGNFQKSVDSDEIKTMAFEITGESVKAGFPHLRAVGRGGR